KTMIQRTVEQASKAVDQVIVATDDQRIMDEVASFGGIAILTRKDHASGSDRIAEVAKDLKAEIIVNVQGDEPFIQPGQIMEVVEPMLSDDEIRMCTSSVRITTDEELRKPGVVKVVTDLNGDALYFSRAIIPYPVKPEYCEWREHLGIYAYQRNFLLEFISWEPTRLELAEGLEQMRVLEHGYKIRVIESAYSRVAPCIDTEQDLAQARAYLRRFSR
ncbi:3-deoxy-manno-octulosonate cytidylyltransferase, partial [Candidatus Bathyarchaeota archaeon]|nr:3-deoxy-manno-octulosonate cytidylyltransferase [Candidatus Bathyarchaeota archaeon]